MEDGGVDDYKSQCNRELKLAPTDNHSKRKQAIARDFLSGFSIAVAVG